MRFLNFLSKWQCSSTTLVLIVSAYFTFILNIAFFKTALNLYEWTGTASDYFIYTLPLVLFAACNVVFNLLSMPFLHKMIIPLFIIISASISYNSLFFNVYFDRDMLNNVLQTNTAESVRMLSVSYVAWIFFLGILPALLYLRVKISYRQWWKEIAMRFASIFISLALIGGVGAVLYQDYASFFRNNKYLPHLIVPSNFVAATVSKIKHDSRNNMPYTELAKEAKQSKFDQYRHVSVIVLGETTRGANWGLNGYSRQTTPKMAARLAKGEALINFSNVSSCGTATAISVPCMFSAMPRADYSEAKAYKQDNVLDILQRSGVNVQWIENNSDCKGVCKNVPTVNTIELDLPEFCTNGECLDNIMLPELDKALATAEKESQDTLIVLHTLGSHGPTYYERYTEKERRFTPTCDTNEISRCSKAELVNTYDNGILYLDQFLDKVIEKLQAHKNWESSLLYISDHGESLGENGVYLHAAPYAIAPTEQTHIPMMMWFSEMWVKNEPFDLTCVRQNSGKAYSQDNLFHTVFSMFDMDTSAQSLPMYDKNLDILASCRKK